MSIPSNITREHLLKAIDKIDAEGLPPMGNSQYYDVAHNNKRYPPKMIVSYANQFANGTELDRNNFTGGLNTPAFKLLKKEGFEIVEKVESNLKMNMNDSFYPELEKFLKQAKTDDLTYAHYRSTYHGFKVRVSFGKGNQALIPWISFLKKPFTTSKGIYPVYLYYKNIETLFLSYGISETNPPPAQWNLTHPKTINEYFEENNIEKLKRYGNSFVFQVYDVKNLPTPEKLDSDLAEIIRQYKTTISTTNVPAESVEKQEELAFESSHAKKSLSKNIKQEPMRLDSFRQALYEAGLIYSDKLVTRFVSSLLTKPFVILTGLSGSGKTKLAQAFTQWICQTPKQYCIVPVGADWTNREPLLGYPNALKPDEYVKPDNGVLDLIINANKEPELPFFIILDEMNLSQVERYFADFLSVMESKGEIPLFAEGTVNNGVPANLKLPSNLFIIGTVNIDETTNMFSPKVLDRANTVEFRVTKKEITDFLNSNKDIDMAALTSRGASMAENFLARSANTQFADQNLSEIIKTLIDFFEQLKKSGAEFGYRSATEILRLINQLTVLDQTLSNNEKLDIAIMQKLLPKLHGSRRKLGPILLTLGEFCVTDQIKNIEKDIYKQDEYNFEDPTTVKFPLSLEKIARMHKGAIDNGFASFAEA